MKLLSLKISGFRNLAPLDLDFTESANVFTFFGRNGQGKTNILEAIYLCALSKSFRTRRSHDFIGFDLDFATLKASTDDLTLEVIITRSPPKKVLKINGLKKNALEFVGHLKAVFFSPDDLAYMAFAPRLRRRYIDVLLCQLDALYLEALMRYESARKQRNALLRRLKSGGGRREELSFWDGVLSEQGVLIVKKRKALLQRITPLLIHYYQAISQSSQSVDITYVSEVEHLDAYDRYLEGLQKFYEHDLASGKTNMGPQRDDLRFSLSGHDMEAFSSRGEWRSLVLALKFAEIELLKEKTGSDPILLLDDVFSELDAERQQYLLKAIGGIQTFITGTHREFFDRLPLKHQLYCVDGGRVQDLS